MDKFRKAFLYCFIAFLAISAFLSIVIVLAGSFSKFEIKVLLTSFTIAGASICCLCCSAFSQQSRNPFAILGMAMSIASGALIILGLWMENESTPYWKSTAVVSVLAVAFAHFFALMTARIDRSYTWVRIVTGLTIFSLASIISSMIIWEIDNEWIFKTIVALAIIAALETLVIPILHKLSKKTVVSPRATITLTQRDDGTYESETGRIYELKEIQK
jgi:hypothetical protein